MKNNEGFSMELQCERVGKAFKSIFEKIKITQVAGELNQLGINVRKTNNEFKTLEEILEEVSKLNNEDVMKAIDYNYIDLNLHINQLKEEVGDKSLYLSNKYNESIERVGRLYREAEKTDVYLKTLENLIETERKLQGKIYSEMILLSDLK